MTQEHPGVVVVRIPGGERCSRSPLVVAYVVVFGVSVVVPILFVGAIAVSSVPDPTDQGVEGGARMTVSSSDQEAVMWSKKRHGATFGTIDVRK